MKKLKKSRFMGMKQVYERRQKRAFSALQNAKKEYDQSLARVQKHQLNLQSLNGKISHNRSIGLAGSTEMIQQRERVIYWLNYDLEDVTFRLENAKETLKEHQAAYNKVKKAYFSIDSKLKNLEKQRKQDIKTAVSNRERGEEAAFEEAFASIGRAG